MKKVLSLISAHQNHLIPMLRNNERKMIIREYYLLPESDYNGPYDRIEGHYKVKLGTVADLVHDSLMLWGSDFDKVIPSACQLNRILESGKCGRTAEWEPFNIDEKEYAEMVECLLSIKMIRPYRTI